MQSALLNHLDVWTSAIETRSTAGRGSSNKLNLYGIKKLRELILELAVRGQLVPQNPDDEPASVLLEKIAAEKARLIKDGKLKKQEPLPPITDDEKPFELPEGWEWVSLSHLGVFSGGKTPSKMKAEYWNGDIPWVTPKDMKVTEIYDSEDHITALAIEDGLSVVEPNSLLFVVRSGILRRAFPVAITKIQLTVNQDLKILNLFDKTIVDYLLLMMQGFEQYILQNLSKTGTTVESIKFDEFSTHYFIFPPLAEQHRIVAKVNELMSLCDALEQEQAANIAAHQTLVEELLAALTQKIPSPQPLSREAGEGLREDHDTSCSPSTASRERGLGGEGLSWQRIATHFDTLFTTEHSIDQLKQTILQLAVMGKLVPQDPNDEPSSVLLQKIAAEKARLVKAGKIKKQELLPPIAEDEKPFELPNGWIWCSSGSVCISVTDGEHNTPQRIDDSSAIPLVTAKNVRDGYMDYGDTDYVPLNVAEKCWKRCKPEKDDILMVSVGATLGRLCILKSAKDMVIVRSVTLLKPSKINVDYLSLVLKSPIIQKWIWANVKQSAQPCLYLAKSSTIPLPIPPLAEQHRIVAKVDELMALCDAMKAQLKTAQTTQLQLADVLAGQAVSSD